MCLTSAAGQRRFALNVAQERELLWRMSSATTTIVNPLNNNILRAVVAVFRHGDRTPKQKLKWKTDDEAVLAFYRDEVARESEFECGESGAGGGANEPLVSSSSSESKVKPASAQWRELKLRRVDQKRRFLALMRSLRPPPPPLSKSYDGNGISDTASSVSALDSSTTASDPLSASASPSAVPPSPADDALRMRMDCVEFVLMHEEHCKVQIKPKVKESKSKSSGADGSSGSAAAAAATVVSAQVIVKWGGALTHAGLKQASDYGHAFREQLFLTHNPAKRAAFLEGLQAFTSEEVCLFVFYHYFLAHNFQFYPSIDMFYSFEYFNTVGTDFSCTIK